MCSGRVDRARGNDCLSLPAATIPAPLLRPQDYCLDLVMYFPASYSFTDCSTYTNPLPILTNPDGSSPPQPLVQVLFNDAPEPEC